MRTDPYHNETGREQPNKTLETTNALKRNAAATAYYLGHKMSHWNGNISTCLRCGREVVVDAAPPPNGIDIAGEAIALQCGGARQ